MIARGPRANPQFRMVGAHRPRGGGWRRSCRICGSAAVYRSGGGGGEGRPPRRRKPARNRRARRRGSDRQRAFRRGSAETSERSNSMPTGVGAHSGDSRTPTGSRGRSFRRESCRARRRPRQRQPLDTSGGSVSAAIAAHPGSGGNHSSESHAAPASGSRASDSHSNTSGGSVHAGDSRRPAVAVTVERESCRARRRFTRQRQPLEYQRRQRPYRRYRPSAVAVTIERESSAPTGGSHASDSHSIPAAAASIPATAAVRQSR